MDARSRLPDLRYGDSGRAAKWDAAVTLDRPAQSALSLVANVTSQPPRVLLDHVSHVARKVTDPHDDGVDVAERRLADGALGDISHR